MRSPILKFMMVVIAGIIISVPIGAADSKTVELYQVTERIWVHTSYQIYNGYLTPSNGLIVETDDGLVLVDTPWNDEETEKLLAETSRKFGKAFRLAVITHAHADRIGGIHTLLDNKIPVKSTALTAEFAKQYGYPQPAIEIENVNSWSVGKTTFEAFYPGPGHSKDNITVWFPGEKLLFAGCLVKSTDAKSIGKTAGADYQEWPKTLNKLLERYPDAKIVIPGHGRWGGPELIKHTVALLEKNVQ